MPFGDAPEAIQMHRSLNIVPGGSALRTVLIAVGIVAVAPPFGRADDAAAIVDKAIRVTANSELRLNRLATVVRTERCTFFQPTGEMPMQRTVYLAPDRIKYDVKFTGAGQAGTMILARNGARGWKSTGGAAEDLNFIDNESLEGDATVWSFITLRPLKQKGATLKALPAIKLNGKSVLGVAVSRPDRPDASVYFDADSGLPVKLVVKVRKGAVDTPREIEVAGYRDFDGIQLPTRVTVSRSGRKIEDWTVQNYQFPDRLDDKLFQKPK